jgi:hypothetical protein
VLVESRQVAAVERTTTRHCMNSMSLAVGIEAVMSFSLWASRTALSGYIQMNYSKVKNLVQASGPGNLDTTISPKTLTVCENDKNQCNSKSRAVSSVSGTILPRHIYILSVSRWLGTDGGSFHGRTHARSLSHDTFHASPQRPHQSSQSPTASNGQKPQAASSYVSHSGDIFDPPPDTSTSLISPQAFHTHTRIVAVSICIIFLSVACRRAHTDYHHSYGRTMSGGNANSLNFFDMNRTPVNAGAPQQPPDQSARTPSNSNDFKNTQTSAEGLRPHLPDSQSGGISLNPPQQPAPSTVSSQPPPKDPTSSGVNQRGIEPPTPERQIRHIKDLLLNLKIRIASCETHARQQGIKREEIWIKFELDRMRIEAHQAPDRRLGDHWKVIVANKVPFKTLQLELTGAFDLNADLGACAGWRT